ncbi:MAG: DUF3717 domain-containing protein [Betaproteobacteria bacterium]|nr:DUF3717 domain-containing protein [Betaproteobacteria bacterium]NCW32768.1 DUF3717 domain-containing protein [Betaproteobacteria bacterium]NCZ29406.1 DUF3717 domain-containing protein [Betaproteobacteria bacterium]NDA05343.1 DUF3717 domain-containing protein [Betaproteobacteria bacterium]NDB14429.1 DUF3717 domain-containing protein [Betaproteobacteria bacterium]
MNYSSKCSNTGNKPMIYLQHLESAINRARAANPASGADARLHADVAVLGAIYGQMIYLRLRSMALRALSPRELEVWQRWSLPHGAQTQNPLSPEDRG